jgi:hypothetical protein
MPFQKKKIYIFACFFERLLILNLDPNLDPGFSSLLQVDFCLASLLLVDFFLASLLLVDFLYPVVYSTILGFRNNFQDHWRLTVCILGAEIAAVGSPKRDTDKVFRINK